MQLPRSPCGVAHPVDSVIEKIHPHFRCKLYNSVFTSDNCLFRPVSHLRALAKCM